MPPIMLIVGAPAVGKSSLSRALAKTFEKSVHIPVDDLRNMVISGQALPSLEWQGEIIQQVKLAREAAIHMAHAYHEAGFAVILDDFYDPRHLLEYEVLGQKSLHKILLYPEQTAAHERNRQRSGGNIYIDAGIQNVYETLSSQVERLTSQGWLILDTTQLSVEESVKRILEKR
jgi:chloramphenicol 3-O-phosphotransferase